MKKPIATVSRLTFALASTMMLAAPVAWAHPDHTGSNHVELSHYVLDPFHAIWLIGVVALAVIAWRLRARTPRSLARQRSSRSV